MPSGASFITHGEYLFERNLSNALPQGAHFINGSLNSFPIDLDLGDQASHALAMARDDDALPTLHVVENAEEVRLGFGCLNCLHKLTSQIDWLKYSRTSRFLSGFLSFSILY